MSDLKVRPPIEANGKGANREIGVPREGETDEPARRSARLGDAINPREIPRLRVAALRAKPIAGATLLGMTAPRDGGQVASMCLGFKRLRPGVVLAL